MPDVPAPTLDPRVPEPLSANGEGVAPPADDSPRPADAVAVRRRALTLLASIFVIAGCGLVYELLIATVSTYLLGSSVTQFSVSIGVFIGAMGLGSHLSQRVRRNLLERFVVVQVALGVLGGCSVALMFWAYTSRFLYWSVLYGSLIGIGTLVGLELPLLTRVLKRYGTLRSVIAQALSFDYVGALVGSLLLPLLLLPTLGMMRTAFVVGLLNIAVAAWNARAFRAELPHARALLAACGVAGALLLAGLAFSMRALGFLEARLYADPVVYAEQTPFQRIVITRWRDDVRLFLDGHLQFCSLDEYRYHEALVHPAMSAAPQVEAVLVLGGGDGLAVREVLKHPAVQRVTLVDLDPRMTHLGRAFPDVAALNGGALDDPRVRVVNRDAYQFLQEDTGLYDVVLADLPDPNTDVLAKLYSTQFYRLVTRRLSASGVFATQATSPFFAREAFWCVRETISAAGLKGRPYHVYVPSFGDWGFVIAARYEVEPRPVPAGVATRYLTPDVARAMFTFGGDAGPVPVRASTMDRPVVLEYYLNGWRRWARTGGPTQ